MTLSLCDMQIRFAKLQNPRGTGYQLEKMFCRMIEAFTKVNIKLKKKEIYISFELIKWWIKRIKLD